MTVIFSEKTDIKIQYLAFSQRRKKGFRNYTELDHRRVLVADGHSINIYGYSHEFQIKTEAALDNQECHPYLITSYAVGKFSRGAAYMVEEPCNSSLMEEHIEIESDKPKLITLVEQQEVITFANFLSDYDPSFVLLMTYCEIRHCSYLKVLKIYNKVE